MMKSWMVRLLVAIVAGLVAVDARAESTLGLGAAYFRTVDSLDKPFEESGVAPVLSYRADLADVVKLQLDGLLCRVWQGCVFTPGLRACWW